MATSLELTLKEILTALPGKLIHAEAAFTSAQHSPYSEMVYDSRKASPRSIFLCIKGERVDGHDFVAEVIKSGAALIIGDNEAKLAAVATQFPKTQFYVVEDSLKALQKLATFYRRKFSIPTIGLTGSSGKTTTKDLIASIFKASGPALVTEGTLNNHWGVPQMVMRLRSEHRTAAFEMGTSGFGEIDLLSSICQPDIGYMTTIGASHLEHLKNEEGVLKAKRELFDWIVEHGTNRVLIFNIDNPYLEKLHQEFVARKESTIRLLTITATKSNADIKLVGRKSLGLEHRYGWEYEFSTPWGAIKGRLPLPGLHNLFNAMSAATLTLASGIATVQDVVAGLDHPEISKLRSNIFRTPQGTVVYDDSYNANPTSVSALFEAARNIRTSSGSGLSKTVAVVGDMLELGPNSGAHHREMGRRAAQDGVDILLATGAFAHEWVEGFCEVKGAAAGGAALEFTNQDDLFDALTNEVQARPNETLLLVKGSRGAKMDQIVERIRTSK